ncbi:unnamed protein product [Orchesella dallaii]|uniref:Uncharacterized protein n=1 Tax=Orchesella dallaii TaxID=48710 RepID=A0ABP1RD50_9HEXA
MADLKTFVLLLFLGVHASSWSTIDQSCSHYENLPDTCNPGSFLVCSRTHVCRCPIGMTWIHSYQRCVFKIDSECGLAYHGGNLPGCPPWAFCSRTRVCMCQQGYKPNRDKTGCTNGAFKFNVPIVWLLITLVASRATKLILV